MKTILRLFVIIFFATFFSNCASIMTASNRGMSPLTINTQPTGANVVITDKNNQEVFKGVSPVALNLKSSAGYFAKQTYYVKLNIDGYPGKIIVVKGKLSGWYVFGNLFITPLGSIIGWLIIDPTTGAMYQLNKKVINEVFTKTASSTEPSFRILDIKEVPAYLKDQLVLISK